VAWFKQENWIMDAPTEIALVTEILPPLDAETVQFPQAGLYILKRSLRCVFLILLIGSDGMCRPVKTIP
jgi:hypothetical protein